MSGRESCIQYPPGDWFVITRQCYRLLMDGDVIAAALLSYFNYRANRQLDPESSHIPETIHLGPISISTFEVGLVHLSSDKQIRNRLKTLAERGFISSNRMNGKTVDYTFHIKAVQDALNTLSPIERPRSNNPGQMTGVKEPRSFDRGQAGGPRSNDRTEPRSFDRSSYIKNGSLKESLSQEESARQFEPSESELLATLPSESDRLVPGSACQILLDASPWNDPLGLAFTQPSPDYTQPQTPKPQESSASLPTETKPRPQTHTPKKSTPPPPSHTQNELENMSGGNPSYLRSLRSKVGASYRWLGTMEWAELRESLFVLQGGRLGFSEVAIAGIDETFPKSKRTGLKDSSSLLSALCKSSSNQFQLVDAVSRGREALEPKPAKPSAAAAIAQESRRDDLSTLLAKLQIASVAWLVDERLRKELPPETMAQIAQNPAYVSAVKQNQISQLSAAETDAISYGLERLLEWRTAQYA